ncbi:MAG: DHH family phosphoesterase [Spirochaetes bacterium]|nr:DHH family phosphoesterase [Spirochaetota bacterium]
MVNNLNDLNSYLNKIPKEIIPLIQKSKNIAVIGHYEPDGDTIGSQLALTISLNQFGIRASAVNQGPFNSFENKKNKKFFKRCIDQYYDLFIIVDVPDKERIGDFHKNIYFEKSIVIDHHITNNKFGKINWVDDLFVSAGEMVFLLLLKMNIGLNKPEVCQHLLNAITSDNGFYQHIRKDKSFSLLASYYLIQRGADPKESYNILYGMKSLNSKKLLSLVLKRIESVSDGRILWTYLTEKDRKLMDNAQIESLFIFREMLSIKGSLICIYFKSLKKKVDVSFRSYDKINVADLAKMFGGGGHKSAAGASFRKNFEEVKKEVINKAIEYIETNYNDS